MYFGPDNTPSCDEVCTDCTHTQCLDHPNHKEWEKENKEYPQKICPWCGMTFTPTSPAQKYCSREENPACEDTRYLDGLSALQFIRFHGYKSKQEFIRDLGQDAWDALQ